MSYRNINYRVMAESREAGDFNRWSAEQEKLASWNKEVELEQDNAEKLLKNKRYSLLGIINDVIYGNISFEEAKNHEFNGVDFEELSRNCETVTDKYLQSVFLPSDSLEKLKVEKEFIRLLDDIALAVANQAVASGKTSSEVLGDFYDDDEGE